MAQKISELREELAEVQESYSEVLTDLTKLIDSVQRHHDDEHVMPADVVFRFCRYPVCQLAGELEFGYSHIIAAVES
jgi:hypothetical protein